MFKKVSKAKEDLAQGGTNYLVASGCYPVNIIAPFASTSKNGSTVVDLFIDHNGQKQVIYGNLRLTNNDGTENKIGTNVFNQLMVISEVDEVSEPIDAELPIGKDGADVDCGVLEDLADIDVILRIQMQYSVYLKNIQEKKIIKGFYRAEDNASASEIVNETEAGVQYKDDTKYFDAVTYENGLDAEAVKVWVDAKRPKGTGVSGGGTSGNTSPGSTAKKPAFGKTRKFGKPNPE
jgi:hypothetical protein